MVDCLIIGGGIVGLSTAFALQQRQPGIRILVLEKESRIAAHQTGRNSGVIHSGIYYKPGSFKAKFAKTGNRSMAEFCREHHIKHEICGKIIVACDQREIPLLDNLHQRGLQNGLEVSKLTSEQVRQIEPHVQSVAGLKVPSTGIVSYTEVSNKYRDIFESNGGEVRLGTRAIALEEVDGAHVVQTNDGDFEAKFLINCAGLFSDRVARNSGLRPPGRIVPFRGEYFELKPDRRHLVKTLIYPVPNPEFPFLGVHFTRMIDGSIHAGPNAVLAFKREGYRKADFALTDFVETMAYPGFWHLARKHLSDGIMEMRRSLSKTLFVQSLQRLIPEIQGSDIVPSEAGVRAQALLPDGKLVDDFLIVPGRNSLHVCNAPSPAATASLEIGKHVAALVPELKTATTVVT